MTWLYVRLIGLRDQVAAFFGGLIDRLTEAADWEDNDE